MVRHNAPRSSRRFWEASSTNGVEKPASTSDGAPGGRFWAVLVPIVGLIAGLLFAAGSTTASGGSIRSDSDSIAERVRSGTRSNEEQTARLEGLQEQVDALTKRAAEGNAAVEEIKTRADALAVGAGRRPVSGPGVEVTLDDSPLRGDQVPKGFTVDDIVVHQQDVQAVVNALWAAGAEAMMLMDQRVISTSAVRCVGNTLILKGRVYSPPYVVTAIGDVDALRAGLEKDKQVRVYREYVSAVGLGYDVKSRATLTLPAYAGSITTAYARALN